RRSERRARRRRGLEGVDAERPGAGCPGQRTGRKREADRLREVLGESLHPRVLGAVVERRADGRIAAVVPGRERHELTDVMLEVMPGLVQSLEVLEAAGRL